MAAKECPMCGEQMRQAQIERVQRVPGTTQMRTSIVYEWKCPECDYYEDADEVET